MRILRDSISEVAVRRMVGNIDLAARVSLSRFSWPFYLEPED